MIVDGQVSYKRSKEMWWGTREGEWGMRSAEKRKLAKMRRSKVVVEGEVVDVMMLRSRV